MEKIFQDILNAINLSEKIVLTAHVSPDADGVGSCLALREMIMLNTKNRDKQIDIIMHDAVPAQIKFLDKACCITQFKSIDIQAAYDLVIILDTGNKERIGDVAQLILPSSTVINIDHHVSNDLYGDINYLDSKASSTSEVLFSFIKAYQWEINSEIAQRLYAALINDTGNFLYNNVTENTFMYAAFLKKKRFDSEGISRKLRFSKSFEMLKLLGIALYRLEKTAENIAYTYITLEDFSKCGATYEDSDSLVDTLNQLDNAAVIVIFKEKENGIFKASIRTKLHDVETIAHSFNGGGHIKAAGFTTSKSIDEVMLQVRHEFNKQVELQVL